MLNSLTSLRFFAALYVVLFHSGSSLASAAQLPAVVQTFLANGYLGVPFFFVLSGFILQFTYRDRIIDGVTARNFFVARFARIYPVYLAALLLALTVMPPSPGVQWPQYALLQAWMPEAVVQTANTNMVAWSLSVEIAFYLAFPVAARILGGQRDGALLVVIGAIAVILISTDVAALTRSQDSAIGWLHTVPLPILRFPEFLLGVTLGELHLRGRGARVGMPLWVPAALLCAMLCLTNDPFVSGWVALGSAFLIFHAANANDDWLSRLLSKRFLVLLGASSYALYLLHISIIVSLSKLLSPSLRLVFQLPILLVASAATFFFIEEPARRWLRLRLGKR